MQIRPHFVVVLFFFICTACQQNEKTKTVMGEATENLSKAQAVSIDTILPKEKENIVIEGARIDFDTLKWAELIRLDEAYVLDLKYATTDNFVEEQMYECPRCFLRPVAAAALQEVHEEFKRKGLRIKLLDCYRPAPVQQKLWDKVPNASYVTPPSRGSMHNRGLAIDLTLVDENGVELDMGTPYDFFGRKAHHTHTDLPKEVLSNRRLLKETMEDHGFKSIRTEWWHYSYSKEKFKIDDMEWECH